MKQDDCPLYKKFHNTIDGLYLCIKPSTWKETPYMDKYDAEDEDGSLELMLKELIIYDIDALPNFNTPKDKHNIEETIFIIKRNDEYFLCETQGENYIKFATNITNISFVKMYDRYNKIVKIYENF